MSLLSAHHVSQANALILSAYLPSIHLHYNYGRIIGGLISLPTHQPTNPYTFGTFISEASLGFRLVVLSAPENAPLHEHGRCATPTVPRGGETKPPLSSTQGKLSMSWREEGKEERGRREQACAVRLFRHQPYHPALSCEISDDIQTCFLSCLFLLLLLVR